MRYTVRKSFIQVIGKIWMPAVTCAMQYDLTSYDVENIKATGDGKITRDAVEDWLGCHSGDFQSVADFSASIEDGNDTLDFPWAVEESEFTYCDCMYPAEAEA
jgi:hypothetical protein